MPQLIWLRWMGHQCRWKTQLHWMDHQCRWKTQQFFKKILLWTPSIFPPHCHYNSFILNLTRLPLWGSRLILSASIPVNMRHYHCYLINETIPLLFLHKSLPFLFNITIKIWHNNYYLNASNCHYYLMCDITVTSYPFCSLRKLIWSRLVSCKFLLADLGLYTEVSFRGNL